MFLHDLQTYTPIQIYLMISQSNYLIIVLTKIPGLCMLDNMRNQDNIHLPLRFLLYLTLLWWRERLPLLPLKFLWLSYCAAIHLWWQKKKKKTWNVTPQGMQLICVELLWLNLQAYVWATHSAVEHCDSIISLQWSPCHSDPPPPPDEEREAARVRA